MIMKFDISSRMRSRIVVMEPIKSLREGDMDRLNPELKKPWNQSLSPVLLSLMYAYMPPTNKVLDGSAVGKFDSGEASGEACT